MKISGKKLVFLLLAGLLLLASCQSNRVDSPGEDPSGVKSSGGDNKIKVVTTILPLYDIVVNVGGDLVEVHNLLPTGGSPHSYEPTPADLVFVEDADLVLKLGLGLDEWMDKITEAAGKREKMVVVVSKGVITLEVPEDEEEGSHGDADDSHHHHEGADPHVWMDPSKMVRMTKNVEEALITLRPDKKIEIKENSRKYVEKLTDLDKEYRETLEKYPRKDFVTVHSFMFYTAKRYGMNQAAVISEFPGKEADPRRIAQIVDLLKSKKISIVFTEPQFSDKASRAIAREINGSVISIDPLGSLEDPERNSYVKNMRRNLESLKEAFSRESK